MKVLGIVAEYNPFHNGHLYHLEQSKAACGADAAICVMSGNFIQRGEPAIVEKRARAEMALRAGIDLVLELPAVYAMSSAEFFAHAAVKILDSLGVVDFISFGSESGSIGDLAKIAGVLLEEPPEYRELLKTELAKGVSYPSAREAALRAYFQVTVPLSHPEEILKCSNNILGIEYLKALKKLGSSITPITLRRISNAYNAPGLTGAISSATAIRNRIKENADGLSQNLGGRLLESLENALPQSSLEILEREFSLGKGPVFPGDFAPILLSSLRRMTAEGIRQLPYVAEGLENRILEAAENTNDLAGLMEYIGTRRYTDTRISRILFSLLTGLTAHEFELFNESGGPRYIRVLGLNKKGRTLLSDARKKATLPVMTKAADYKACGDTLLERMLKIEASSTDQYVLAFKKPEHARSGLEFTGNIIRLF